ncbi:MAG: NADH-quinone oxidoreductase subunit N [Opitutia bacterium]|nr:NADH-quinone oxidoreductase subunit M [Opitutales bacterium]PHX79894.1 MAG: NADH-quinone oxidoreductase subunit N [Opitutae bacterium]
MEFSPAALLTLTVTAPIIVGLILLAGRALPHHFVSGFAFVGFALPAVLAPWLLLRWTDPTTIPAQFQSVGFWGFGFGLNGLGAPLLAMTALVGLAAGIKALTQEVEGRNTYLGLILFMLGGTLGVFGTDHLVGCYFFHEFALIPTFILTLFWGGEGRRPAAMQMAIYLTAGAMASLAGILIAVDAAGVAYGAATFENVANGLQTAARIPAVTGALVLFGLGTLASLFPFHSWAAPGYSAAPTPVSMLHAGALKKFGLYGIILLGLSSLDITGGSLGTWFLWFAVANVLLVGLICLAQRDLKQLLAWSSVAHMGPIFLGIWVCGVSGQADGLDAAAFLMVAHGLSCAALFLLANAVRARASSYRLDELGGLAARTPVLATLFIAATMASIGLPGFGNFWGEMGIFLALRGQPLWLQALVASTVVISAVYALRAVAATFFGPASATLEKRFAAAPFGDLGGAERFAAFILLGASMTIGFVPSLVTKSVNPVAADITTLAQPNPKAPAQTGPTAPAQR